MCGPPPPEANALRSRRRDRGREVDDREADGADRSRDGPATGRKDPRPGASAMRRAAPFILLGYLFDTICYLAVLHAFLPSDLSPRPRYCPGGTPGCVRRDLFAFQVVSFLNLTFLGVVGVVSFYVTGRAARNVPPTPRGRYFGNVLGGGPMPLPEADAINAAIVVFQGWDFVVSFFFEEHRTMVMMMHHLLAFLCGFFCLAYEVNPYYAVYFGGVCEFSSIFLSVAQVFEIYPQESLLVHVPSLSYVLPTVVLFSQAMFVATFFMFRIVGWAQKTCMMISDARYIIDKDLIQRYSPGSGWFLWYLMAMSVLLGALQVYWFTEIIGKVMEILNG